jgi:hypothetical protein
MTIEEEYYGSSLAPGESHVVTMNNDEDSLVLHCRRLVHNHMDLSDKKSDHLLLEHTMVEEEEVEVDTVNVPLNDVDDAYPNLNTYNIASNNVTRRADKKMRQLRRQEQQWIYNE